ncbi:hypothetical protein ISR8_1159 [Streptococcus pyogenes]|nr:hypothetical protein ISR7_0291 [Streptococcus pyogenes]SDV89850.1 hypothetical protein ISR8_1159 [Streptococcus pyogenes]
MRFHYNKANSLLQGIIRKFSILTTIPTIDALLSLHLKGDKH